MAFLAPHRSCLCLMMARRTTAPENAPLACISAACHSSQHAHFNGGAQVRDFSALSLSVHPPVNAFQGTCHAVLHAHAQRLAMRGLQSADEPCQAGSNMHVGPERVYQALGGRRCWGWLRLSAHGKRGGGIGARIIHKQEFRCSKVSNSCGSPCFHSSLTKTNTSADRRQGWSLPLACSALRAGNPPSWHPTNVRLNKSRPRRTHQGTEYQGT